MTLTVHAGTHTHLMMSLCRLFNMALHLALIFSNMLNSNSTINSWLTPFFYLHPDDSYELFYRAQDYPVQKYFRQQAYFEVALLHSANPQLELILDNCWATLQEERTSLPRWDIIVDG